MDQDKRIEKLNGIFLQYQKKAFPRIAVLDNFAERVSQVSDAQVDFAEEDAYLVGLTKTFLSRKKVEVEVIRINTTIDKRLEEAMKSMKESQDALLEFIRKRQKMLELAKSLSLAAGVPFES